MTYVGQHLKRKIVSNHKCIGYIKMTINSHGDFANMGFALNPRSIYRFWCVLCNGVQEATRKWGIFRKESLALFGGRSEWQLVRENVVSQSS